MPSFTLNTTSTTTRSLTGFEDALIGQNGALMVLDATAITADGNNDIAINGDVMSDTSTILSTGEALDLVVGSLGNILSTSDYVVFADVTSSTEAVNAGTISSAQSVGIGLFTADASAQHSLVNTGATSTIVNSGTIASGAYGIYGGFSTDTVLEVWRSGGLEVWRSGGLEHRHHHGQRLLLLGQLSSPVLSTHNM